MVAAIHLFLFFLCLKPVNNANEPGTQIGCFDTDNTGLSYEAILKGKDDIFKECLQLCKGDNFTFAGIRVSPTSGCLCGRYLGGSERAPMQDCITTCSEGECVEKGRALVYILGNEKVLIDHGVDGKLSSRVAATSLRQFEILGAGVVAGVVVLSLLIHWVRVSRRRSRLMKLYVSCLERGETSRTPPPSALSVSNALCAEFFCCCCRAEEDHLDYLELINDLDIDPKRRHSFSKKVEEYISRCEKEKQMDEAEIRQMLKKISRGDNLSSTRGSLRKLAEQYANARRQKRHKKKKKRSSHQFVSALPVHVTRSSPPKLCRRLDGSSLFSLDKTFPNSTLSMYTKSNLPYRSSGLMSTPADKMEEALSVSQCSRSSSKRLIPVNLDPHPEDTTRRSRRKYSRHSESARRLRRGRDESDTDSYQSDR